MLPQSHSKLTLIYRMISTKPKKNIGQVIKNFNQENKRLFGPALKKIKNKNKSEEEQPIPNKEHLNHNISLSAVASPSTSDKSTNSSEFYWLFERNRIKKNSRKNIISKGDKSHKIKDKPSDLKQPEILNCSENKCNEEIIPFKNIKEILKFPLSLNTNIKTEINENLNFNGRLPSVGKILQATLPESSRAALINWKLKKIAEIGDEAFIALQNDHLRKGKELHSTIETFLLKKRVPKLSSDVVKLWDSIEPVLQSLQPMDIKLTESRVNHPYLKYRGIVDCVSTVENNVTIIEWKKSDKIKNDISATYDAPLQLCAYLGALNTDPQFSSLNINKGFVVIAYTNGKLAEIHRLDENQLQKYWYLWLKRLEEFWVRTRDNTLPEAI